MQSFEASLPSRFTTTTEYHFDTLFCDQGSNKRRLGCFITVDFYIVCGMHYLFQYLQKVWVLEMGSVFSKLIKEIVSLLMGYRKILLVYTN